MERLTERHDHGIKMVAGYDFSIDPDDYDLVQEILERLAQYEDTGLEPDMIEAVINGQVSLQKALEKYTQAEEQGRLVVLPCKVGDTVWCITDMYNNTIKPAKVREFVIADGGILDLCVETDNRIYYQDSFNSFFLTREEAERAMEGGTDNA